MVVERAPAKKVAQKAVVKEERGEEKREVKRQQRKRTSMEFPEMPIVDEYGHCRYLTWNPAVDEDDENKSNVFLGPRLENGEHQVRQAFTIPDYNGGGEFCVASKPELALAWNSKRKRLVFANRSEVKRNEANGVIFEHLIWSAQAKEPKDSNVGRFLDMKRNVAHGGYAMIGHSSSSDEIVSVQSGPHVRPNDHKWRVVPIIVHHEEETEEEKATKRVEEKTKEKKEEKGDVDKLADKYCPKVQGGSRGSSAVYTRGDSKRKRDGAGIRGSWMKSIMADAFDEASAASDALAAAEGRKKRSRVD